MAEYIQVPLKHHGSTVGQVRVFKDGRLEGHIESELLNNELRDSFMYGLANGLSIKPNLIPAIKKEI